MFTERLGPYRLLRPIGAGAMGEVYAAVHEQMEQTVALKLLSPDAANDPQIVARFLKEGRALSRIQHPGVVRVLHCDRLADGTPYLAMELLEGRSLRDWMARSERQVSLRAAQAIGWQVADVMIEVHSKGIVHRDLKPENILLCPDEDLPFGHRVKLLDFGIAKVPPPADGARLDTQVQTGGPAWLGTATYMAPEQCRNAAEVTSAADVYSMGVMLFELLAGQPPFAASEPVELITSHVRDEPPSVQAFAPQVPGALAAFVASMLAKEPSQRPTMRRVREVLGHPWENEREECPVPGLSPFTETQSALFFGRGDETQEVLSLLDAARGGARRWVQIEGPSGAGKSSLVQAGLLPRLREAVAAGGPAWRLVCLRPFNNPVRELAQALIEAYPGSGLGKDAEDIERSLRADAGVLARMVTAHTPAGCCVLLLIEQLEDLFTLFAADGLSLDALISAALAAPSCPLRLLTTLRSDFVLRLDRMPGLARLLDQGARYPLRAMDEAALAQVIQGMARRAGLQLAEGLAERMVRDAAGEGSRLPLLGHALHGFWALRGGTLWTHERYEQLGGVSGALARHAEELLDSLRPDGRERAKWILLDLVQVGRGAPDTRRPRTRQEVLAAAGGGPLAERVLMRLSGARAGATDGAADPLRLVALSSEPVPELQRVELVHDTLLRQVPSIVGWIRAERTLLERRSDLEVTAHAWEEAGCPEEGLPSGSLLDHYRGLTGDTEHRERLPAMASVRAARFLDVARRLDRRRRWIRRAVSGVLLLSAATIGLAAVRTAEERRRAETHLKQMIRTTDQIVSDADWTLSRLPHTLESRRKMLGQIDEDLARLPEKERDEPEVRRAIIKIKHRRSDLARMNESLDRADQLLVEAREEISRGLSLQPEEDDLQGLLALNLSKRGKVALARGRLADAGEHFAGALEILESQQPRQDSVGSRRTLAVSYSEQADLELELGRPAAAAGLHDRAVALLEKNGEQPYDRTLLAQTLASSGQTARRAGDLLTASARLDRALRIQTAVVQSTPGDAYFRWVLAQVHAEHAALAIEEGAHGDAVAHHRTALALAWELHRGEPTNKSFRLLLCESVGMEEALARARGQVSLADAAQRERCSLADTFLNEDPDDARFQRLACR